MRIISFCDKDENKITLSKNGEKHFNLSIEDLKGGKASASLSRSQMEILLNASDDLIESDILKEDA